MLACGLSCAGCDTAQSTMQTNPPAAEDPSATSLAAAPVASTSPRSSSGPVDKTFDEFKFEIEAGEPFEREMLTPEIEQFVGKTIRIRGFMLPTMRRDGIKQFVLVRDDQVCCFGPGAAVFHNMRVTMVEGDGAEYTAVPISVTGELGIEPFIGPDGKCWAVYTLDATQAN